VNRIDWFVKKKICLKRTIYW